MVDNSITLPPFRGLNDFLLNSAQFKFPALNDPNRWSNRVVNNLLYYQTNYLSALAVIILLSGVIRPNDFLYGFVGTLCAVMAAVMALSQHHVMRKLRQEKMWALLGTVLFLAYMICTSLRSMAIFAFPFAFSVLLICIHASTRTRSLKNRISNKVEQLGIKKSPMGLLMEMTGYEIQLRVLEAAEDAMK